MGVSRLLGIESRLENRLLTELPLDFYLKKPEGFFAFFLFAKKDFF